MHEELINAYVQEGFSYMPRAVSGMSETELQTFFQLILNPWDNIIKPFNKPGHSLFAYLLVP